MNRHPGDSGAVRRAFAEEATRLAIESVENGWGGPFGAVIVRDGEIIGRGQNRVLLTGVPIYHAEITAIMDACARMNPKEFLGPGSNTGTLEMVPNPGALDGQPQMRARMLEGCEMYVTGAPCPMCLSAIHWARIDRLYFGGSLADAREAGFDDDFQYTQIGRDWHDLEAVECIPGFEREVCLEAFRVWKRKAGRKPY